MDTLKWVVYWSIEPLCTMSDNNFLDCLVYVPESKCACCNCCIAVWNTPLGHGGEACCEGWWNYCLQTSKLGLTADFGAFLNCHHSKLRYVDEATVDTSSSVESSKLKDSSIRSLGKLAIANQDQRIWNRGNCNWGRCWSSRLWNLYFPMWCYRGELFYHSMLCKWTTSLADSTLGHLPMKTKF